MVRKRHILAAAAALLGCNSVVSDGQIGTPTDGSSTTGPVEDTENTDGSTTGTGEGPEPKLDVSNPDLGAPIDPCHDGDDPPDFSYIWVANSPEGTVSKIDTETGLEVARYRTGPGVVNLEPSRTSVNLVGDAVVVNRGTNGPGSITKIAAIPERCVDTNDNGKIDTSEGPDDVISFGYDECVLWNRPLESAGLTQGPRPVAWEGQLDEEGCAAFDPRVWVGFYEQAANRGVFRRLDGATGDTLDEVVVPSWSGQQYGPYGGAITGEGDFVVIGWQVGPLVRIDAETLAVDRWDLPPPPTGNQKWAYGMALDPGGNAWVSSLGAVLHFDMAAEQWTTVPMTPYSMRGVAVDSEWRVWLAVDSGPVGGCGLGLVDASSKTVIQDFIPVEGCSMPVGVSVDPAGYVWLVDQNADLAFKIDPDTHEVVSTTGGLDRPYTYSDMTGGGLKSVVFPPAG